ncbi:DUF1129 family protein [Lysinibacillus yapensis]|uniref:DUF1129 family protein n=2 Tax=Ureibacillus yapensis TaxID=2304605 RepID=A0A396SUJ7_9BACL|nr:DUF1129 family protein [Lysinibacillus yapensis]
MVYIRTNALKSERATEEVLLEMLDHLLEAQKEGKSAEEVFGKAPKELAEEIIQSLPKEPLKKTVGFAFEALLNLLGWAIIPWGIFAYFKGEEQTIYLGSTLLFGIILVLGLALLIYYVFRMVKQEAFDSRKKLRSSLVFGTIFGLLIVLLVFLNFFIDPFGPTIQMSYFTIFGLGCFLILAAYLFRKSRESQ